MRAFVVSTVTVLTVLAALVSDSVSSGAGIDRSTFQASETAGIRRRNDVVTIRSTLPKLVDHRGGFRVIHDGEPIRAQAHRVELPVGPPELVIDFIDHFKPFETRQYALEFLDETTSDESSEGIRVAESADAYRIVSSGVVSWTVRKDLAGFLDFSWKETDYIADDSLGFWFAEDDEERTALSGKEPTRAVIERPGPIAVSLRFDYDDWPPGARSSVRLEFPRTKSWIHAIWIIDGELEQARKVGAELNLRLDGPEALVDFGAGDFVYATVTKEQAASLAAGPRDGVTVPWEVSHGNISEGVSNIVVAPLDRPTVRVHGWAHVMDDKRATALAMADFGESARDFILINGNGHLRWQRHYSYESRAGIRQLEFWLHFVTMPVHIGARTSPRSMQEPLEVRWISE